MAGQGAECDGGGLVAGTHRAGHPEFTGTLTGEYDDEGDPPWRRYPLNELTHKPKGLPADTVGCKSESTFPIDK